MRIKEKGSCSGIWGDISTYVVQYPTNQSVDTSGVCLFDLEFGTKKQRVDTDGEAKEELYSNEAEKMRDSK